jgi:hypothetical protein
MKRRSHNSRRKARAGGAGGAMRRRTGEARQPEARAGRGEPRWLPGAGGWGMRLRPERGERWAFCRRQWQQSRRRDAWRAGAVYVLGRRACAGCGLSHQGAGTSCAARVRSLCCTARSPRCAFSRRAGPHRAAQGTRALHSQAPRALRCARTVQRSERCAAKVHSVPHLAGKARGAARKRNDRGRNDRGRNDRRRMEIVAKTRDEPMLRAWARSGGELRR